MFVAERLRHPSRPWRTRTTRRCSTSLRQSGLRTERRGWSFPTSERVHERVLPLVVICESLRERLRPVLAAGSYSTECSISCLCPSSFGSARVCPLVLEVLRFVMGQIATVVFNFINLIESAPFFFQAADQGK